MLSFFGSQCLKDAVVARVREHQRLDQIAQQIYWDGSKGCAIGCVLHSDEHMAFEQQLGLPVFLAYMDEHIFESLPLDEAKAWPLRFIEAVPVGVELALVFPRFMHWLMSDPQGMRQYANRETLPIVDTLVELYARRIAGVPFDLRAAWSAARSADSAAWSAESAVSAARRAAWSAVNAAWGAESAERAAWSAARSAEDAAWGAESAARSAAWSAVNAARRAAWSAAWSAVSAARRAAWSAESAWRAAWSAERAESAARRAERAAWRAEVRRQAEYLVALLQSYDSLPLAGLPPCTAQLTALHF